MCSVIGALLWNLTTAERLVAANNCIRDVYANSYARGRDGRGFAFITDNEDGVEVYKDTSRQERHVNTVDAFLSPGLCSKAVFIGNMRAEPTTEYVARKRRDDQQPYTLGAWSIVHNGTIANDKDLRTGVVNTSIDSAAIVEQLALVRAIEGSTKLRPSFWHFRKTVQALKGSYAILAMHHNEPDHMMVAVNYRPVWYAHTEFGVFFASSRDYLPAGYPRTMVEPYTVSSFIINPDGQLVISTLPLLEQPEPRRALVVCSGGLDSVVAAAYAQQKLGYEVTLLHFLYGSRAQGPEVKAVRKVSEYLGVEVLLLPISGIYDKSDSPLLRDDSPIAGGEAGAEFAHEWVPARNLVMLSLATAYAEAKGFDTLVLGNNLEEAGAYPDNEPEFIARFNDLLHFAVGDGKQVHVEMPVGNLMKHEIVALGHEVGAPLHLTWSCYRNGDKHCGTCGPCYMRRTAFKINGLEEVIEYVSVD